MIDLICPFDKQVMLKNNSVYSCPQCSMYFPIDSKIIKCVKSGDHFYEGRYQNLINYLPHNKLLDKIAFWTINSGYIWQALKYLPKGSKVLELGCAGGVKYFGQIYEMIGLDISFNSLLNTSENYQLAIQADATKFIPLPDNSLDGIVSSYFWEHIEKEDKSKMLKEFNRILKPGGKIIFLYDVETKNPLIYPVIKKDLNYYKRNFLDNDGHIGYHLPEINRLIFSENSFNILFEMGMQKTIFLSLSMYEKLKNWHGLHKYFSRIMLFIFIPLLKPYLFFLRITDTLLYKILPDKWSTIYLSVVEKKVQ